MGIIVLQNPFRYPRQMDGLQSVLSQVPTIGVYVVGAAAVAAFGLTGSVGAGTIAPGATPCLWRRIGSCMN
jgi:hypothetical protein